MLEAVQLAAKLATNCVPKSFVPVKFQSKTARIQCGIILHHLSNGSRWEILERGRMNLEKYACNNDSLLKNLLDRVEFFTF